jgi:hypothetical protein
MTGAASPESSGNTPVIGVKIHIDAETLAIAASVQPPKYGLADLISKLPGELSAITQWIPDINLGDIGLAFDPAGRAVAVYATAGIASADPSADVFIANVPVGTSTALVVGVSLSSSVDLSGTPLFGSVLSGIAINALRLSYATKDIPPGKVVLPPPAPQTHPGYKAGPVLSFSLTDGKSSHDFTLTPAGMSGDRRAFPGQLTGGEPPPPGLPVQWFSVQKSIGPLTIGRIGIVTGQDEFGLALDASIVTTALSIDLTGFALTFKPSSDISLQGLHVALDGLGVGFKSGSLDIRGSLARGLVEVDHKQITQYSGAVQIQTGAYGISAVGAFADLNQAPSLFIFGLAQGQFGGPPAFFVTGIAAGFGYNRGLRLPAPDEVKDFPFVLAATQGASYLPDPSVQAALSRLTEGGWAPPQLGAYWVAAGVQFTSFKTINGFALLTVQFGQELVIAFLGVAALQLPQEGRAFAYAELTLDAVLAPSRGTFQVTALLTPNSFVLHQDCLLTGGFAFFLWFGSNPHAGDFVVTLGGYHPNFTKPDWYPDVPRLGFRWNVSREIQISGGAYFAVTPAAAMGGGRLSMSFASGDLRAWFIAQADFIMYWNPFYFDIRVAVSIGASYTLNLWLVRATLTVSLSADVELWGPPLAGVAHVNWSVISFTIAINGGGSPHWPGRVIDWPAFVENFLPKPDPQPAPADPAAITGPPASPVCRPRVLNGMAATITVSGQQVWVVSGQALQLGTETAVPATLVVVAGPTSNTTREFPGPAVGVYPMGSVSLRSQHELRVRSRDGATVDLSNWAWTPVTGGAPYALWGTVNTGQPSLASAVVSAVLGITGTPAPPVLTGPPRFPLSGLAYTELPDRRRLPIPVTPPVDGGTVPPGEDTRQIIAGTVAATLRERSAIVDVLNAAGVTSGLVPGDLTLLAQEVFYTFQDAPMAGPLGSTGPEHDRPAGRAMPEIQAPSPRRCDPVAAAGGYRPLASFRRCAAPARSHERASAFARLPRTWASSALLDGWAGPAERLFAARQLKCGPGARPQVTLGAGDTVLWQLPPGEDHLIVTGGVPLWIAAFDRQYQLIDTAILPAGTDLRHRLPDAASRVAITGLPGTWLASWPATPPGDEAIGAGPDPGLGWHASTALLQVAPQALLAHHGVIRPQSPHRIRQGHRGSRDVGVVTAADLIADNWVATSAGRSPGWVETHLPRLVRSVALQLRRDSCHPVHAPAAEAAIVEVNDKAARLSDQRSRDGRLELLLTVTESAAPQQTATVLTQPAPGWVLAGVLGFCAQLEGLDETDGTESPLGAAPAATGLRTQLGLL